MWRERFVRAPVLSAALVGFVVSSLILVPLAFASPNAAGKAGSDGRAVVLLNLQGNIDRKSVTRIGSPVGNDVFAVYLARLDELSAPKQVGPYRLDKRAEAGGWHAWQLQPGLYYMLVLPPGLGQNPPAAAYHAPSGRFGRFTQYEFAPGRGAFWSSEMMMYVLDGAAPADFAPLSGFSFEVTSADQVVYVGSLSVACKAGRGLFGSLIDSCGDFELTDDATGAQQLVLQAFPGLSVQGRQMMRYGEPAPGLQLGDLAATSFDSEAPAGVAAGVGGATLDPGATIHGVGRAVMVYNLLAATFEMTESKRERRQAEEAAARLAPCMQRLGASLDRARYGTTLVQSLEQSAAERGITMRPPGEGETPAEEQSGYRLAAHAPVVRLVAGGGPDTLALDLVVELRLYEETGQRLRYVSLLWFGPELPALDPFVDRSPLYLRALQARPPARTVAEWCGESGPALLAEDIDAGLRNIAAQFVRDMDR